MDGVRLEVDPLAGGRVTSLRSGGFEVLSGADVDASNYGSTFWTSPQSAWGWPPPFEIDRGVYSVAASEGELVLTSAVHEPLGVRVTKRFSVDAARRGFAMEYVIDNAGGAPTRCAPWEVTRVAAGGLTFFPTGPLASGALALQERAGAVWFDHGAQRSRLPADGLKSFAVGERGWLAHVRGGLLFIKRFAPVPCDLQAPGEAEIEVYANPHYVELEVQGRYAPIAAGGSVSWTVLWCVREVPAGIAAAAGSADLVACVDAYVRGM
jgi:hypothetical protein